MKFIFGTQVICLDGFFKGALGIVTGGNPASTLHEVEFGAYDKVNCRMSIRKETVAEDNLLEYKGLI